MFAVIHDNPFPVVQSPVEKIYYRFQDKDFGCVIGRGWPEAFQGVSRKKGLSPPCCLPKIIILKAVVQKKQRRIRVVQPALSHFYTCLIASWIVVIHRR
jgi:hypothetical protein